MASIVDALLAHVEERELVARDQAVLQLIRRNKHPSPIWLAPSLPDAVDFFLEVAARDGQLGAFFFQLRDQNGMILAFLPAHLVDLAPGLALPLDRLLGLCRRLAVVRLEEGGRLVEVLGVKAHVESLDRVL